jgi:hypothetical protein
MIGVTLQRIAGIALTVTGIILIKQSRGEI